MKRAILILALPAIAAAADPVPKNEWVPSWQNPVDGFQVQKNHFGSGQPARGPQEGVDVAAPVADGYYHVPGFLPGHPTAATIYPQVQTVECTMVGEKKVCDGYQVNRSTGRGEYVYIQPVVKEESIPEQDHPVIVFIKEPEKSTPVKAKKPRKKKPKAAPVCK